MPARPHAPRRTVVLAVDDKPANLMALDAVLGAEHEMVFVESGSEAIAAVQSRTDIDVVLMDIQMPVMDGFEAAARIKHLPQGKDLPIIFVTAEFVQDPHVRRGYEVGGIDYFTKPFDPEILRSKVNIYASLRLKDELLRERERRIAEVETLRRLEQDLVSAFDNARIGVLIVEATGVISYLTDEVRLLLGSSTNDPLPGPLSAQVDRAKQGMGSHERVDVPCPDGSRRTLLSYASLLRGPGGERVGVAIVFHDVTDAAKVQVEVEESRFVSL